MVIFPLVMLVFQIKNGDFPVRYVNVYQRVATSKHHGTSGYQPHLQMEQ
jgi:hypothetical protein